MGEPNSYFGVYRHHLVVDTIMLAKKVPATSNDIGPKKAGPSWNKDYTIYSNVQKGILHTLAIPVSYIDHEG